MAAEQALTADNAGCTGSDSACGRARIAVSNAALRTDLLSTASAVPDQFTPLVNFLARYAERARGDAAADVAESCPTEPTPPVLPPGALPDGACRLEKLKLEFLPACSRGNNSDGDKHHGASDEFMELVLTPTFSTNFTGPYVYTLPSSAARLTVTQSSEIDPLVNPLLEASCAPLVRLSAALLHGSNLTVFSRASAAPFPLTTALPAAVFESTWDVVIVSLRASRFVDCREQQSAAGGNAAAATGGTAQAPTTTCSTVALQINGCSCSTSSYTFQRVE
jgi:hypothetical protein